MICQINRNEDGTLRSVLAPNGKPSRLYSDLLNEVPENYQDPFIDKALQDNLIMDRSKPEISLALWGKGYTLEGERDENGEVLVSVVLDSNAQLPDDDTVLSSLMDDMDKTREDRAGIFTNTESMRLHEFKLYNTIKKFIDKPDVNVNSLLNAMSKVYNLDNTKVELIRTFAKLYPDVKFQIHSSITQATKLHGGRDFSKTKGFYHTKTNSITLFFNHIGSTGLFDSTLPYDEFLTTILHEYTHAATHSILIGNSTESVQLKEIINTSVKNIQKYVDNWKAGGQKRISTGTNPGDAYIYFTSNVRAWEGVDIDVYDEFIAYFMQDNVFRKHLTDVVKDGVEDMMDYQRGLNQLEIDFLNIHTKNITNINKNVTTDQIFNRLSAAIYKNILSLSDEKADITRQKIDDPILRFTEEFGITVNKINSFRSSRDNQFDIFGAVDLLNKMIYLSEGEKLNEELAHFLVEVMGDSNPYIDALMDSIHLWDKFTKIEKDYDKIYQGDQYKIRKEAVGQLIAEYTVSQKNIPKRLLEILKAFFDKLVRLMKGKMNDISIHVIARDIALSFISNDYERLGITNVQLNMSIPEVAEEVNRLRGLGAYYYKGLTGDVIELRTDKDIDAPTEQIINGKKIILTKVKTAQGYDSIRTLFVEELGIEVTGDYFSALPSYDASPEEKINYLNDVIRTQIEQRKQVISSSADDSDVFVKQAQLNKLADQLSSIDTAENIRIYIDDVYKTFTGLDSSTNAPLDQQATALHNKLKKRYIELNKPIINQNTLNEQFRDQYYNTIKSLEYIYNYSRLFDDMINAINGLLLSGTDTSTMNPTYELYKTVQLALQDGNLTEDEKKKLQETLVMLETKEEIANSKNGEIERDLAYKLGKIIEIREKIKDLYTISSTEIMSFALTGVEQVQDNMASKPARFGVGERPEAEIYKARIAKLEAQVQESLIAPTRFTKKKIEKIKREIEKWKRLLNSGTGAQIYEDLRQIDGDINLMSYLFSPLINSYDSPSALWAKRFRDMLYSEMEEAFNTRDQIYDAWKEFSDGKTAVNVEKLNKNVLVLETRKSFRYNQNTALYETIAAEQWRFIGETTDEDYISAKEEAYEKYNKAVRKFEKEPFWKNLDSANKKKLLTDAYQESLGKFYNEWHKEPKSEQEVQLMFDGLMKLYNTKVIDIGELFNRVLGFINDRYVMNNTNTFNTLYSSTELESVTLEIIKRNFEILKSDIREYGSSRVKKPVYKQNPAYLALSQEEKKYMNKLKDLYAQMQSRLPRFARMGDYIPMIRKSTLDRILNLETGSDIKEFFMGQEQDDVNDGIWGTRGVQEYGTSGSKNIPVRFVGHMDPKDVSLNLPKVLTLFEKYSRYYSVAEKLRPEATMMITALKDRKVYTTDPMGNPVWNAAGVKNAIMLRVTNNNTNYGAAAFEAFVDRVIYGKTKKAEYIGSVRVDKVADGLMEFASKTQLGLNVPLDLTNMLFTNVNTMIEAIGGDSFTLKDWWAANKYYYKHAPLAAMEHHVAIDKNILSVLAKTFDPFVGKILDNYGKHIGDGVLRQEMSFNSILFKTKEFAEHNGNMIPLLAILHKEKAVNEAGRKVPLLEALEMTEDNQLKLKGGFTLEGEEDFDSLITRVRNLVHNVNRGIQGNYAWMDQTVISTRAAGRLLMMYRKFIEPGIRRRYAGLGYSAETSDVAEGYFATFFRLAMNETRELLKFLNPLKESSMITPKEKANIRKAVFELLFVTILALLVHFGFDDDDEERSKGSHFTQYVLMKTLREMSFYVNPKSAMDIVQNPSVIFTVMNNIYKTLYQVGEDIITLPFDGDIERYDRKTGMWEKGDPKWLAYFLRTLGLSGYTADPEYGKEVLRKAGI